jgi:hypothetical protein
VVDRFLESVIEIVVQLVVVLVTLFLDLDQDEGFEASESSTRKILGFLRPGAPESISHELACVVRASTAASCRVTGPISSFWLGNWI